MSVVLFSSSSNYGLAHLTVKTFDNCGLHWKRAVKKSAGKKKFRAGSELSTLRAISGAKIDFLACFFFKT
jgi:hypothetical protein